MYEPNLLPSPDLATFSQAVREEFIRLAQTLSGPVEFAMLKTLYTVPSKLIEGMIVKADGTSWNPGSGAGIYAYRGGAWTFLG